MATETYDLIVLGAGSAARDGAGRATREHGARVALVESTRWGGSCPNVACRPTKAYVVAAEQAHDARRHAFERGLALGEPVVDLAQTRRWKDSLRRTQDSWKEVLAQAGYELVSGVGSFVDRRTVRVGEREITADRVLVAAGGRT